MTVTHVVGIDPGLVHTGMVRIVLDEGLDLSSEQFVIDGTNTDEARDWVISSTYKGSTPSVFIERYRPRSHYGSDERMIKAERDFKAAMPYAQLLSNTGINKVVTQDLLELLDLWKFSTVTHHQDLRAAARIAVLGILRNPEMNKRLADYVEGLVLDADAR